MIPFPLKARNDHKKFSIGFFIYNFYNCDI